MAADASGDVYTLDTCPVSGMKLGSMGDAVVKEIDGREVRFCCGNCPEKFEADAATYIQKIDTAIAKQQTDFYPLTTCVISGEKLGGDMGDPIDYVHNNRLVRFCCKGCIKKFEAEPAKFIAQLDKAIIHEQGASYSLATCIVSGEELGGDDMGDPIDFVVANRLIRFCCKGCVKDFKKDPAKFLSKLDGAGAGMKHMTTEHDGGADMQGAHGQRQH